MTKITKTKSGRPSLPKVHCRLRLEQKALSERQRRLEQDLEEVGEEPWNSSLLLMTLEMWQRQEQETERLRQFNVERAALELLDLQYNIQRVSLELIQIMENCEEREREKWLRAGLDQWGRQIPSTPSSNCSSLSIDDDSETNNNNNDIESRKTSKQN